jgi:hypothetical protein
MKQKEEGETEDEMKNEWRDEKANRIKIHDNQLVTRSDPDWDVL